MTKMKTVVRIKQKEFEAATMRLNMSYKALAKKLGISRVYLSQIKNDRHKSYYPSGQLRTKILKVMRCKFDEVFEVVQIPDNASGNGALAPKASKPKLKKKVLV